MKFFSILRFQLAIVSIIYCSLAYSQVLKTGVSTEDFQAFQSKGLHVVQGLFSAQFDSIVEQSLEKYWTFTEYVFIDSIEYESMKTTPSYYFLVPKLDYYDQYSTIGEYRSFVDSHVYWNFQIVKGNARASVTETGIDNTVTTPIASTFSSLNRELPLQGFIPVLIKNLQYQCLEKETDQFVGGRSRIGLINLNNGTIKEKPLYILDSDLNPKIKSLADVQKYYKGEVNVVTEEEYVQLINDNADVHLVYCINDLTQNYVQVFELSSGKTLYYKRSVIHEKYPHGVIKYHIKKWN